MISGSLRSVLQDKCDLAGVRIERMDLIDICYTPAIAQSLLQIQQAQSKVDARQLIVHGACSIVTDSLEALARKGIDLDPQHQANLVKKLLVITGSHQK